MTESREQAAQQAVEQVARESYGRVLSYLCARTRDVAGAEDALSDALLAALTTWPRDGVPANPAAWLLTTARHALVDHFRHEKLIRSREPELRLLSEIVRPGEAPEIPDDRLQLLFVCAHPAIDPGVRTPLMLQTVLGVDAARIAQAFMVPPATMGQRLVRVKTKIRKAGIPFEVPREPELPERLEAVLEAIYAAYGIGWDEMPGGDPQGRGLSAEAIWLARVLVQLIPDDPEAHGLLALMLHCEARRPARRGTDGSYVPLSEQDPRLWSQPLMAEAESLLATASMDGRPGRFQLEAAIQSVHAERRRGGRTDWAAIVWFYEQLVLVSPALGTMVAYAAALSEINGPDAGLTILSGLDQKRVQSYQPFWAVRASLLQRLGRAAEAGEALDRAIGLAQDPAVRRFLLQRHAAIVEIPSHRPSSW